MTANMSEQGASGRGVVPASGMAGGDGPRPSRSICSIKRTKGEMTLCGRFTPSLELPVRHALKFGRKCSVCDHIAARKERDGG